jgi:hypothetical protein
MPLAQCGCTIINATGKQTHFHCQSVDQCSEKLVKIFETDECMVIEQYTCENNRGSFQTTHKTNGKFDTRGTVILVPLA